MRISDWSSDVCSSDLRDVFLNALDGTIYDDDPKQGVVDGRVFRHPDLKFQFEAPAGFTINNGTQSLAIQGNGGQAQFAGGSLGGGGWEAYSRPEGRRVGKECVSMGSSRWPPHH